MAYDYGSPELEEGPEGETLYYGIKRRPVYYVCMRCGFQVLKEELESMPAYMCPRCGYRIFMKLRAPPSLYLRKVYAI